MNAQFFYEMGRLRKFKALIPVFNTDYFRVMFSTRSGNIEIFKGDGSSGIPFSPAKMVDATINPTGISQALLNYDALFTGNIEVDFLKGKNDVYSFILQRNAQSENLNISNFGNFISQFPNLYSYQINIYGGASIINGNFLQLPPSVERVMLYYSQISGSPTIDFDGIAINSNLKWIEKKRIGINTVTVKGDLAKLPLHCNHVNIEEVASGSSVSYSTGKTWASAFDTLSIPLSLTTTELDNLLIDMNNSITTKIGAGAITLGGYRSAISDAAVAGLTAKGFTVNVNRVLNNVSHTDSALLRLDFQNNFDVYSNSGLNILAGGTSNQPTFALSGRKPGEYCAVFNGSQSIKTVTNLPINSDKVTLVFAMKTDSSTAGIIAELSADINSNNAFNVYLNVSNVKNLNVTSRQSGLNQSRIDNNSLHGNVWNRIVVVIDRSLNASNEILIYVNGSLATFTKTFSTDNVGNFVNNILFIGQRGGSTLGFVGSLMHYKVHNYPFTPAEVTADYNAFL